MTDVSLTERQRMLLSAVCRDYIVGGEPVSSKLLIRRHGLRWSSATIRQELAVLEAEGLLARPHRSAGCTPTQSGLSRYVADLPPDRDLDAAVRKAVETTLGQMPDPEKGLRAGTCVLAEVSGCLAVTFLGSSVADEIRDVDVVALAGSRALVVLTLAGEQARIVPVDVHDDGRAAEPDDLDRLRAQLRQLCRGQTLPQARGRLLTRLHEREARLDHALASALRIGLLVCREDAMDPLWIEVSGQPVLAKGVAAPGRLAELLSLLEDDQRLAQLLCQLLPEPDPARSLRAEVRVGAQGLLSAETSSPSLGLSLVGCRLPAPSGGSKKGHEHGAVVLLGPDRMDYAAVIPLVEYAARALAARVGA